MKAYRYSPSLNDPQRKRVNRRTAWLALGLGLWSCLLILRLIQLQVLEHGRYRTEVIDQSRNKLPIRPRRGTIFDCQGKILARSLPVESVYLTPTPDGPLSAEMAKVEALKDILNLTPADLQALHQRIARKEHFIYLKRQVMPEIAAKAEALGLPGIFSHSETKRFYPNGRLAAHVLGGVNIDEQGQAGVEFTYNGILQGRTGQALVLRDAKRRKYRLETLRESEPGQDITLTLDETIQYIVEKELEKAVLSSRAAWGTVIISRPASGEILALASFPNYDPNDYPPASAGAGRNRAFQFNFEPGSTFKIITAAAALENGAVSLAETFDCRENSLEIPGKDIRDHKPFGRLSFSDVFVHSSNIGTIRVGERLGETVLHRMIQTFGFGHKTGLDLPGEEEGIFHPLARWTGRTLPSLSIGYEISVTALQLLQALNAVANHGLQARPFIVTIPANSRPLPRRIISPETANSLTAILERAVEEGTGQEARIDGYRIAGKTGTTQKFDPQKGGYSLDRHLASFGGFFPAEAPALSMIVVIDEPQGQYYGGQVAAPLFRQIGRQVLRYLKIYPRFQPGPGITAAPLVPGGTR
jgi:cell division protein FtsI/penicillin-binding protein 2